MIITTINAICRGEISLEQPQDGYRFNIDSVILAHFAQQVCLDPASRVVDLGAGCGIVGLLLAKRWPYSRFLLVEIQEDLAFLAKQNVSRNNLHTRVEARCLDLRWSREWSNPPPEIVISNPPFFALGDGRPSPNPQVSQAKHELSCTLDELLIASAAGLPDHGKLVLIYSYKRVNELLDKMTHYGIPPQGFRRVLPMSDRPCTRVLVVGIRNYKTSPIQEFPDLIVAERPGVYSKELQIALGETSLS